MTTKLNGKAVELYVAMTCMLIREEGQDLIEYSFLAALIALAAAATMKTLDADIIAVFTNIGATLVSG